MAKEEKVVYTCDRCGHIQNAPDYQQKDNWYTIECDGTSYDKPKFLLCVPCVRDLKDWIELGDHITAMVADSEGPLTDQIKVLTAKRMSAEDYRRYLLGNVYRRAFFVQDSGHAIDQKTTPERILVMMRFCRDLDRHFPLLQDKERARTLADQLGGKAYEVTLLEHGYEKAYEDILEGLQGAPSEDSSSEEEHAAV